MKNHSLLVGMLTAVLLLGLLPAAAEADDGPGTQICMAIDGSSSIKDDQWTIMLNGIAAAIENEDCVRHDGSVELTVVEFSEVAELEVGPVVITSANAATVAEQIRNIGQQKAVTNMWLGFDECRRRIVGSQNFAAATKQIINVTTDGKPTEPNHPDPPFPRTEAARDAAIAAGVDEIDVEAIGPGVDGGLKPWLRDYIVYPQPGTYAPPYAPPGWVDTPETFEQFAAGVCYKFPEAPGIDIEKRTNGRDADAPTGPYIPTGDLVTWEYIVTNTGDVDLIDVVVTDDTLGDICTIALLPVAASETCTAKGTAVAGQYENLGTATGTSPAGLDVSDTDPSHYFGEAEYVPEPGSIILLASGLMGMAGYAGLWLRRKK